MNQNCSNSAEINRALSWRDSQYIEFSYVSDLAKAYMLYILIVCCIAPLLSVSLSSHPLQISA